MKKRWLWLFVLVVLWLMPFQASAVSIDTTVYSTKWSVGSTNAVIARTISVSGATIDQVTSVGIILYDSWGNEIASKEENPKPVNGVINAWYDVNKELGKTLYPGCDYSYRFFARVNGAYCLDKSYPFTTQSTGVKMNLTDYSKYSIGTTNAVLAKTISVSGASISNVSKVGIVLYNEYGGVLASKSESPKPVGSVINAWYDVNAELNYTLNMNTKYYFAITATINGVNYISDPFSFRTDFIRQTGMTVYPTSARLNLSQGETVALSYTVQPANATYPTGSWSSSNTAVATVSAGGVVMPVGVGSAVITCTAADGTGVCASCAVEVISGLNISDASMTTTPDGGWYAVGDSASWKVSVQGAVGTVQYKYLVSCDGVQMLDSGWGADPQGSFVIGRAGIYQVTVRATDSNGAHYDEFVLPAFTAVVRPNAIALNAEAIMLADSGYGSMYRLKAVLEPEGCLSEPVRWRSSDEGVVTVRTPGLVTAVSAGTAMIEAYTERGVTARCQVTVLTGLGLTNLPEHAAAVEREAFEGCAALQRVVVPERTALAGRAFADCAELLYVCFPGEKNVIEPDAFMDSGKLTILCYSNSDAHVYARQNQIPYVLLDMLEHIFTEKLTLSEASLSIRRGGTAALGCVAEPADCTDPTVQWYSENYNIATVDGNGVVTGVSEGTTRVFARANGGDDVEAYCEVTVRSPLVTSITLNQSSNSMLPGGTLQLYATALPEDAENRSVVWSSSNSSVAEVSSTGLVTARNTGNAVITCTAADGSGVSVSCSITVQAIKVTNISLSAEATSIVSGSGVKINASVKPANATNRSVTWSSSNTAVATVDSSGYVKGIHPDGGTVTITCTANDGSGVSAAVQITVNRKAQKAGVVVHPVLTSGNAWYRLYPTVKHLEFNQNTTAAGYAAIINQFDVCWGENDPYVYGWYEAKTPYHKYTYCNYFAVDVSYAMGRFIPIANTCENCGCPVGSSAFSSIDASGKVYKANHYMWTAIKANGLNCSCDNRSIPSGWSTGRLLKWFTGDDGSGKHEYMAYRHADKFGWIEISKSQAAAKANSGYMTIGINKGHIYVVYPHGGSTIYISQAGANLMSDEKLPASYNDYRYFYNPGI